jgi:hypothetical protein
MLSMLENVHGGVMSKAFLSSEKERRERDKKDQRKITSP